MSKLNRVQKIILCVIVVFVGVGVLLRVISGSATNHFVYDGFTMLKYGCIDYPVQSIKEVTQDFANLWSVHEENKVLRHEISKNPSYKARYENEKNKNNELMKALKISNEDQRFSYKWANVIARDITTWNNMIQLDVGKKDGIKVNQAVVSVEGLIGKVSSVSQYTCSVKLLTSEDKLNMLSIKVIANDKNVYMGVLQGFDRNSGRYVINLFDETAQIKKGMNVVTSGNGGVYPSGLYLGEVESVQALINQSGQTIYVKPVADFQTFEYVGVVSEKGDAS